VKRFTGKIFDTKLLKSLESFSKTQFDRANIIDVPAICRYQREMRPEQCPKLGNELSKILNQDGDFELRYDELIKNICIPCFQKGENS
jgi:hypothetical protein